MASLTTRHPPHFLRWLLAATLATIGACGAPDTPSSPGVCRVPTPPAPLSSPEEVVPCPTAAELDVLDSEIAVSFENGTDQGDLVCRALDGSRDLTEFQKDVYQALVLMKSMTFDAPLPWTHRSLYDWFQLDVAGVRIRAGLPNDFCCEPSRVINLRAVNAPEADRWSYLAMMVHEARHIDGFRHSCGGRDNTIDELGSFGAQYYLMVWIGSHWPAATEAQRAYTLNRAAWLRVTAFCQECL